MQDKRDEEARQERKRSEQIQYERDEAARQQRK